MPYSSMLDSNAPPYHERNYQHLVGHHDHYTPHTPVFEIQRFDQDQSGLVLHLHRWHLYGMCILLSDNH